MDLTQRPPRSPYDCLDGLSWMPRLIDKARAKLAGTLGEYVYNSGCDRAYFRFLGITPEAFLEAVAQNQTDEGIAAWLRLHAKPLSDQEKQEHNHWHWAYYGQDNPKLVEAFFQLRERSAPGHPEIMSICHLLAHEEGHPILPPTT
jgi:hypothetical protein